MKEDKKTFQKPATEKDELRGRFTVWIEAVCKTTRINYLKRRQRDLECLSLEDLSEDRQPVSEEDTLAEILKSDFSFESSALARAFGKLHPVKQQILKMIYVDNLSFSEIAEKLGCSIGNIYNHHSMALKMLRSFMKGEKT